MTNDEFEKLARESAEEHVTRYVSFGGLEYSIGGNIHKENVETFIIGAKWTREQCSKENVDIFFDRVTETMERSTEMSILEFRLLVTQKELESERAKSLKYREALESVTTDIKRYSCANHVVNWVLVRNEKARQLLEDMSQESQNDDTSIEHGAGRDE